MPFGPEFIRLSALERDCQRAAHAYAADPDNPAKRAQYVDLAELLWALDNAPGTVLFAASNPPA